MELLHILLTICPIQIGWKTSIQRYPNWRLGYVTSWTPNAGTDWIQARLGPEAAVRNCFKIYSRTIILMASCELCLRPRVNGRMTYTSPWSLTDRICPTIMMNILHWPACLSFQHISFILAGSCHLEENWTREWILIQRTRRLTLPHTKTRFWNMWWKNTVPDIADCQ